MKLKKLFKDIDGIQIKGSKDLELTGICSHSKKVAPGNLYVALRGEVFDGNQYIEEAVTTGVKAVVTDLYDPFLKDVTQIIHHNPKEILKDLSLRFYDYPSRDLYCVGITGTNGKTTTSFLVKYLLESLGEKTGLIGTLGAYIGETHFQTGLTTPDLLTTQKLLREMNRSSCMSAVMEVSSHSLDQNRVYGIEYDVTLFTNLTTEHLDYHKTLDAYFDAKSVLFSKQVKTKNSKATWAVLNGDDSLASRLKEKCSAQVFTFGKNIECDLVLQEVLLNDHSSQVKVSYKGDSVELSFPLVGLFNVYNVLAAISVALVKGADLQELVPLVEKAPSVKGRLQRVDIQNPFSVFIDYAHTPDALEKALLAVKQVAKGRVISVFGCGGDRDMDKRSKMGKISSQLADFSVITSDNPRSENPEEIIKQIEEGFISGTQFYVEVDREKAISHAISIAKEGDCLLIAGKGHETSQIFENSSVSFDDYEVVKNLCLEIAFVE